MRNNDLLRARLRCFGGLRQNLKDRLVVQFLIGLVDDDTDVNLVDQKGREREAIVPRLVSPLPCQSAPPGRRSRRPLVAASLSADVLAACPASIDAEIWAASSARSLWRIAGKASAGASFKRACA